MNEIVLITAIAAMILVFGVFTVAVGGAIAAEHRRDRQDNQNEINRLRQQLDLLKPPNQRKSEALEQANIDRDNRKILVGDGC